MAYYFLNTGVIFPGEVGRRTWESNSLYGFVSAGVNPRSIISIRNLQPGHFVFAYISTIGFVAFGKVLNAAVPIDQFLYNGTTLQHQPYINMHPVNGLFAFVHDRSRVEHAVRIQWINILNTPDSVEGQGIHIYPGVCCSISRNSRNGNLLADFIEAAFNLQIPN